MPNYPRPSEQAHFESSNRMVLPAIVFPTANVMLAAIGLEYAINPLLVVALLTAGTALIMMSIYCRKQGLSVLFDKEQEPDGVDDTRALRVIDRWFLKQAFFGLSGVLASWLGIILIILGILR